MGAARLAVITAAMLAVLKMVTGISSGSMALISSAADSLLDLLTSLGNLLALQQAQKPADKNHPYGHGKFETAATFLQSLLIGTSGFFILFESTRRLLGGGKQLHHLDFSIAVLVISSIVSWLLSRHLRQVGEKTASSALQADAIHYATDVYTNLALLAGLIAVKLSGWHWIDPGLSILVGVYILKVAYTLLKECLNDFLDAGLPVEQLEQIRACIEQQSHHITGYHHLRTRRSGNQKMIDFHLAFCRFKTIQEAHDIADRIEQQINDQISNADVTIHLEPTACEQCHNCEKCTTICDARKAPRVVEPNDRA